MDLFWTIMMIIVVVIGVWPDGFWRLPFWGGLLSFCDMQEGLDVDWSLEFVTRIAYPFAIIYSIVVVVLLYVK